MFEKAREKIVEALVLAPSHAQAEGALKKVQAELAAAGEAAERAAQHKKWMDEGMRLRLAEKPKAAAEAYSRAAENAPPGSRQAADAAAACMHDHYKQEGLRAKSQGNVAGAVEMFQRALAKRTEPETRRLYAEARKALDEKLAKELPVVKTKLAEVETAENSGFPVREKVSLEKEAAAELARLKGLPPEKAMEEARALLVRFSGTPAAEEIEGMALPAGPNE
jgi:tetratricopeptide (TPR) repeat protein